jgi:hypothetical protein
LTMYVIIHNMITFDVHKTTSQRRLVLVMYVVSSWHIAPPTVALVSNWLIVDAEMMVEGLDAS